MRLRISAEPYEPKLVCFDKSTTDVWSIEFGDERLPIDTWNEYKKWHDNYMPFTDLKGIDDLNKNKEIIDLLDKEGILLTKKIAKEFSDENVNKFIYFSYVYYYLVSIDLKGNETKILNPREDDWYKV